MRSAAPMLALCATLVACADATAPKAAPKTISPVIVVLGSDHHPPPPDDTSAVFVSSTGETMPRLRVIYNLNVEGTAGYLRFGVRQPGESYGTPNAIINFAAASELYPEGQLVGKGVVTMQSKEGWLQLTLSRNLESSKSFIDADCNQDTTVGRCGQIEIVGAKMFDPKGRFLHTVGGSLKIGVDSPRTEPPPPPIN